MATYPIIVPAFENFHIHARERQMLSSLVIVEAAVWKTEGGYTMFGVCARNFVGDAQRNPTNNLTADNRKSK